MIKIVFEYNRVDNSGGYSSDFDKKFFKNFNTIAVPLISILRISSSANSSTSSTQIMFEYDGVDDGDGSNSNSNRKYLLDVPK